MAKIAATIIYFITIPIIGQFKRRGAGFGETGLIIRCRKKNQSKLSIRVFVAADFCQTKPITPETKRRIDIGDTTIV